MRRNWVRFSGLLGCCWLWAGLAVAEPLTLAEFAAFEVDLGEEGAAPLRRAVVTCLQGTRTPAECIGVTLSNCAGEAVQCVAVETAIWEGLGHDLYLALRQALGGPEWIDTAHLRIAGEMAARCAEGGRDLADAEQVALCSLNEAAGRAIDLRFALVAP